MEAIIEIFGNIGFDPFDPEPYVTLDDVRGQFEATQRPTSITVYINSPGGLLTEGYAIYDYLISHGLPITTVGNGIVGSIATVIFLSGDRDRRFLRPNARFLVHNPMPAIGILTDADGYEALSDALRSEEDELVRFYNTRTSISSQELRNLMREERFLNARETVEIGFSSGIREGEVSASIEAIPMVAKYVSKTTLKIKELHNSLNQKQENMKFNLKEGLKNLLNQAEADNPETETIEATEETTEEAPVENSVDWEAKYNELKQEMESMGSNMESQVTEVITEMSTQFVNRFSELKTLIQNQAERIETLENKPVAKSSIKAQIPKESDHRFSHMDKLAEALKTKVLK